MVVMQNYGASLYLKTGCAPSARRVTEVGSDAIRPFRVHFPDEALADLKRRIAATRWPERETVTDQSQGVQLATVQNLALLADRVRLAQMRGETQCLPEFITKIDGGMHADWIRGRTVCGARQVPKSQRFTTGSTKSENRNGTHRNIQPPCR